MRCVSTNSIPASKIIPIVPESLYRSLEYSIKKLLVLKIRLTLSQVTKFILQLKENNLLGKFKIDKNKLNPLKIRQALRCLCTEKKVIKKRRYFESIDRKNSLVSEIVHLKSLSILRVVLEEKKVKKTVNKNRNSETQNPKFKNNSGKKQNRTTEAMRQISFSGRNDWIFRKPKG